jgi:hypothetical protein
MDHLRVLRDKIGRFREEIADIQELNGQFRSGMVQRPKSLTDEGLNAYKQSSASLYNLQNLAVELFRQRR